METLSELDKNPIKDYLNSQNVTKT
jgi:hypothetical protein